MDTRCITGMLAVALVAGGAQAQVDLHRQVREVRLSNGMVWLVVERPEAPVFTGYIRVRVGGADEEPGGTGLAHLFEHMAFKGTPVLGTRDFAAEKALLADIARVGDALAHLERQGGGEGERAQALRKELAGLQARHEALTDEAAFTRLYQLNGAVGLNATTDKDLTSYFVSFPRNRLELWALTEASRLASPVLRDFYRERDVVMEERRMRIDSQPGGALYEELNQVAFTTSPYRWPTVGYMEDLEAMTLAQATAFHARYYTPSNMVGALVGAVTLEEVQPLLERTFGAIPARPAPPGPTFATPPRRQERRSTVFFDASPRMYVAFHKPALPHPDDDVFDVIQVLLGEGRTSRLFRRLVLQERLAQSVGVFTTPGNRLDNLFVLSVVPLGKASPQRLEAVLQEELQRLATEPVPERELQKVRNRVLADLARSLDTNEGLATSLSYFQAVAGSWRYLADGPKRLAAITPEDIQRVARTYFRADNRVVVDLQRPAPVAGEEKR